MADQCNGKTTAATSGPAQHPASSPCLAVPDATTAAQDLSVSDEWDASKVPPSRFQKRKGSIYSTPSSRDGHIDSNYAAEFHAKHAEKGYDKLK